MIRRLFASAALAALACTACDQAENGVRGGPLEAQLAAATVAADVTKVNQLLASGADPNRMALVDGHYQSPWKLAIRKARRDRPSYNEIARAMLDAHANLGVAFGEEPSRSGGYTVQVTTPILALGDAPDVHRALMAAGLDPRSRNAETALVLACESRLHDVVHVLVEAGVPVNPTNVASTPLLAAIGARDVALMTYLEDHGARENPTAR